MLEKIIEQKLGIAVRTAGGRSLKFTTPTLDGVPDRLILMPRGKIAFVELKQKGKQPRPLQVLRMKQLTELGFKCFVLDDIKQIEEILNEI